MSSSFHIWHPFTQEALDPSPLKIVRAEGVYLYTDDGRRLIDGISSWWVNLHGHGHPAIVQAISEQAARRAHLNRDSCSLPPWQTWAYRHAFAVALGELRRSHVRADK